MVEEDEDQTESRLRQFQELGYALFPRLLDEEVLDDIVGIIEQPSEVSEIDISGHRLVYDQPELVFPIIASTDVLDLLERVMGPCVQIDSFAVVSLNSQGDSGISWHRDLYGNMPRGNAFQRPLSANLLIYLQDLENDVGPLRVVAGSHREHLVMSESERARPHPRETLIRARASDGVLLHHNLVHSRSPNHSPRPRRHISVVYNLSCMKSCIDPRDERLAPLLDSFAEVGDPRLLRLLGTDPEFEGNYNNGFMQPDEEVWAAHRAAERDHTGLTSGSSSAR